MGSVKRLDNLAIQSALSGELGFHEARRIMEHLGPRLLLLAHHYQRPEIVALAHRVGDSLELSQYAAANTESEYIVFAGVRFMAEAAALLAASHQQVFMPAPQATCPMADMAPVEAVERALLHLREIVGEKPKPRIMPIAYMNTHAATKALVGRHGGAVCTSSHAQQALQWALAQREKVLFLPDEHLGRNAACAAGVPPWEQAVYDPAMPGGGLSDEEIGRARVILWKGYCPVHMIFESTHIEEARTRFPSARILVHPECRREVVVSADGAGSTSYLVRAATEAQSGSVLVIGTEMNLITRMQAEHADLKIEPLAWASCHDMNLVTLENIVRLLQSLEAGTPPLPITVSEDVKAEARAALARMLEFSR